MTTESAKAAKAKYDAKTAKYVSLKLNTNTDAEIIDLLSAKENVQGYLKQVLRAEILNRPKFYPPTRYSDKTYGCGICGHELQPGHPNYCSYCGQAIDWSKKSTASK